MPRRGMARRIVGRGAPFGRASTRNRLSTTEGSYSGQGLFHRARDPPFERGEGALSKRESSRSSPGSIRQPPTENLPVEPGRDEIRVLSAGGRIKGEDKGRKENRMRGGILITNMTVPLRDTSVSIPVRRARCAEVRCRNLIDPLRASSQIRNERTDEDLQPSPKPLDRARTVHLTSY